MCGASCQGRETIRLDAKRENLVPDGAGFFLAPTAKPMFYEPLCEQPLPSLGDQG
jgi:hypothetical protein